MNAGLLSARQPVKIDKIGQKWIKVDTLGLKETHLEKRGQFKKTKALTTLFVEMFELLF